MWHLSTFSTEITAKKKINKKPSFLGKLKTIGKNTTGGAIAGATGGAAYGGLLAARKGLSSKSIAPVLRGSLKGAVASGQEGAAIGGAVGTWNAFKKKSSNNVKKAKASMKKKIRQSQRRIKDAE